MGRSRFVAPRFLTNLRDAQQAFLGVQDALDTTSRSAYKLGLQTRDFAAVVGQFVRVSPAAAGLHATLPAASAKNGGESVTFALENVSGDFVVHAPPGQTVNGAVTATFNVEGIIQLFSNGMDAWTSTAQLPAEAPGGAALDAEYLVGAAHGSLPSARVATDSTEIDADLTVVNVVSWALRTASVVFSKLQDLTGLSVLGRAANSSGVMAAITATAARQALRNNDAGTTLEWGHPVEIRNNANTDLGDVFSIRGVNGTNTTVSVSAAAGAASFSWGVDDFPLTGLADQAAGTLLANITAGAAPPTAHSLTTFAGAGLTYTNVTGILAVGAGTGITVNANDVAWSGLSVQNNNSALGAFVGIDTTSTTSIIATSASNITEATVRFERAALTGAITASQNDNATLFAGNRVNDTALANREFMDFASGTRVTVAANDSFAGAAGTTCRYTFDVNLSPNYAWTGIHSFTNGTAGVGFFVQMPSGQASFDTALFSVDASSNIDLDAGNVLELAGGASIDLSAPFVLITGPGPDGFLVFDAATASTPSLTANRGMFWVNDPGAPATLPMFTDDANVDHRLAYVDTTTQILQVNYSRTADASISITPPTGATWFEAECLGAGGGGGGADAEGASEVCAGGGGGGGGWFRHRYAIVSGNITGSIGSGGSGGNNTGADGNTGQDTVLTYNGVTRTAIGGGPGIGSNVGPSGVNRHRNALGGNGGTVSGSPTEFAAGEDGAPGMQHSGGAIADSLAVGGRGGAAGFYGGGPRGGTASGGDSVQAGGTAVSPGSGGGGGAATKAAAAAQTGAAGGTGANGLMRVVFYSGAVPPDATIT